MAIRTLICTVGTSLFFPCLDSLTPSSEEHIGLAQAYKSRDWEEVAIRLCEIESPDKVCGAEINSIHDMARLGLIERDARLYLCYSATKDGRDVAEVLSYYFNLKSWRVELWEIAGLQDESPREFRTLGLRNLAKSLFKIIRESGSPEFCAINATGGYKAQIAIAVLVGQAIGVPVYYKHERFSEIISLPPLPIALDFQYWLEKSGVLLALERDGVISEKEISDDWDEKMEALIERVAVNGDVLFELSPVGIVFLEAFKEYLQRESARLPTALDKSKKKRPKLPDHSWGKAGERLMLLMGRIVDVVPYVQECHTSYLNPDLYKRNNFRLRGDGDIEGVYSEGGWTARFVVITSARNTSEKRAAVADLNLRLADGEF